MDDFGQFDELEIEISDSPPLEERAAQAVAISIVYNTALRQYVNAASGVPLVQATVTNEMRLHVAGTFDTLDVLTRRLYNGQLTLAQWQIAVASELKDAHLAQSMYAVGGKTNMGAVEFGRVGGTLADEYRFLANFADDIAVGRVSQAQALARIKQYGKATQQSYWREFAQASEGQILWVLHPAEHCVDCIALAGDSPFTRNTLPTFPGAGATQCRGNCNCTLERVT
jgi:hypothetical protein